MDVEAFKENLKRLGVDFTLLVGNKLSVRCPFSKHENLKEGRQGNIIFDAYADSGECGICGTKANSAQIIAAYEAGLEEQKSHDTPPNLKEELKVWSVGEILALKLDGPKWLVENLIGLPNISILIGPPENFKSWLALHIALSVAKGTLALGKFQCQQGHVLIIDEEGGLTRAKFRMNALGFVDSDPVNLMVLAGFKADKREWMNRVMEICRAKGTKLIVIDSLVRVHGQNENDAGQMAQVFEALRAFSKEGVSVLLLHHPGKAGEAKPNHDPVYDARGSSDIPASMDTAFNVRQKSGEDIVVITQTKARDAEKLKPFEVRVVRDENRVPVDFQYVGIHDEAKKKAEEAADALPSILGDGIMSYPEIEKILLENYGKQAIRDGLKIAIEERRTVEQVPKAELPDGYDKRGGKRYYRKVQQRSPITENQ